MVYDMKSKPFSNASRVF